MSTMGSLKFCACTSEVTSAALREERGGGVSRVRPWGRVRLAGARLQI